MAYTLGQLMNMDLYQLTEKNHSIGNLFMASAMIHVLDKCKAKSVSPSKVKFGAMTRRPDNRFAVHVSYG